MISVKSHGANFPLEKLIVDQLVTKFVRLLYNPKVHCSIHKSPSLDPILSEIKAENTLIPRFLHISFGLLLKKTPWF
jgi:hypothetical protein